MSALSIAVIGSATLKSIISDFSCLRLSPSLQQTRHYIHRPKLRNPSWFVRKARVSAEDKITPENQAFIKEIVQEKFGPPAIIKGIPTYKNAAPALVKTENCVQVEWTKYTRRTGLLARKIGNYPLWLKNGKKIHTTLLQIIDNHVVKYIPPEEYKPTQRPSVHEISKYGCVLVGAESVDPSALTKEYCGLFKDSGVMPKKHLARFLVTPNAALAPGTPLNVTHFRVGDFIDVRGKTIDRGFQGVMKRHGFKGMPASHGVTKTHRRPGNIGGGGEKGRVWPGTKMPGHMGNRYRILKGLRIWRMNTKYNVMWVQGLGIAGKTNSIVYCYDTILPLRKPKTGLPTPTSFDEELDVPLPEDIWYETVHDFKDPSVVFAPEK